MADVPANVRNCSNAAPTRHKINDCVIDLSETEVLVMGVLLLLSNVLTKGQLEGCDVYSGCTILEA
jgi:hypothetical protein